MLIEFTDDKTEGVPPVETHEGSFLHGETEGPVRVQLGEGMAWGIPTAAPQCLRRGYQEDSYNGPWQESKR